MKYQKLNAPKLCFENTIDIKYKCKDGNAIVIANIEFQS